MKKNLIVFAALLVLLLILSACGCVHENWTSSENGEKICADCETLYCEINGHSWFAATCEKPKYCENCNLTEGEALGHSWTEANCEDAKTCSACGAKDGEALGHSWLDATTEAPKTCETCAKTEGERIITDERFKTANCSMLFGKWEGVSVLSGENFEAGFDKYLKEFPCIYTLEFSNDGKLTVSLRPEDIEGFTDALESYTKDAIYAEFAAAGFGTAAVDEYVQSAFGISMDDYIAAEVAKLSISDIFSAMTIELCYYVENNQLYLGIGWSMIGDPEDFSITDGILYYAVEEEQIPFTKVE